MRIQVFSDLHLEFWPFDPPQVGADVVVLAGDTHVSPKGLEWAKRAFSDVHVVMVLGNHEYYKKAYPSMLKKLQTAAEGTNIHVLDKQSVNIDGVRFLGCSLWAGLNLFGDRFVAVAHVADTLTDFKRIRVAPQYRRMWPSDMAKWHSSAVAWLSSELGPLEENPCVVVSHHAPSARSLGEDQLDDPVNAAYASDLEPLILSAQPLLWIHGHIHRPADYTIGKTRIVCNPRGYSDNPVQGFQPDLVVRVEST